MNFSTVKNLRLVGIADRRDSSERVILQAINSCNLARYAIVQTERGTEGVSSTNRLVFWFPDAAIEKGHYILLYTRAGTNKVQIDHEGDTLHIYYWGITGSAWSKSQTPTLVHINSISYK